MKLRIEMANEFGDPEMGGYSGVDMIVRDRETRKPIGTIQGISFEADVNDITLNAHMVVLLEDIEIYDTSGKGFMCTIKYTDSDETDECLIKMEVKKPEEREANKEATEMDKYTRSYWFPSPMDMVFYHAESGREILNATNFKFQASIDDVIVQPELTILGSCLIFTDRE